MLILYLGNVIDENRFHNCVGESKQAFLVPVSTKGITAGHENWNEQHSKQDSYLIQWFFSLLLNTISLRMVRSEETGEKAVFASKDTMKQ